MENNTIFEENKFIDPEAIINQLDVSVDSIVADFGCGSGYFSIPMATKIAEGQLFSLDVLPQALETVESKAKIAGISNIKVKRVNLENERGSTLEDESLDWVIVKDMLFQNKGKNMILKEAYRVLNSKGKVIIVEWSDKDASIGPEKSLKISPEELKKILDGEGFKIEKEIDAGDFHYGYVVSKK